MGNRRLRGIGQKHFHSVEPTALLASIMKSNTEAIQSNTTGNTPRLTGHI
eukprot:m.402316 g.402316  ORF g.402316 m.402316 type:complete len:50 (+) comp21177_c0_seq5:59-208(+)